MEESDPAGDLDESTSTAARRSNHGLASELATGRISGTAPLEAYQVTGGTDEDTTARVDQELPPDPENGQRMEISELEERASNTLCATNFEALPLIEDIYSLNFIAAPFSQAFFLSWFVGAFQVWILVLILYDLLKDEDKFAQGNKFKVPLVANGVALRAAQYSATFIAIISQDDVMETFRLVTVSYDPAIVKSFPNATRFMWVLTNTARCTTGVISILVSFAFIVQANNVLNLFMNFAAVTFVSLLDNGIFELSKRGFFTHELKDACESVASDGEMPISRPQLKWLERVFFLALLAALMIGLGVAQYGQWNGNYLYDSSCTHLEIKFPEVVLELDKPLMVQDTKRNKDLLVLDIRSDSSSPPSLIYPFFSGEYFADRSHKPYNGRPIYYERVFHEDAEKEEDLRDPTAGMFYYCKKDEAWVFTIKALGDNLPEKTLRSCEYGWLLRSPRTKAASLEDVRNDGWSAWTGVIESVSLSVTCNQCHLDTECGLSNGSCDKNERLCVCLPEWDGRHCEKERYPWESIKFALLGESSADYDDSQYDLMLQEGLDFYGRPVYADANQTTFVAYTGGRWIQTDDFFAGGTSNLDAFRGGTEKFHAYWHLERSTDLDFLSDPDNTFTPAGVKWNVVRESRSVSANSPFGSTYPDSGHFELFPPLAKASANKNLCGRFGIPNNLTKECDCMEAFGGIHCEYAPDDPYVIQQSIAFRTAYESGILQEYVNDEGYKNYHERFWSKYASGVLNLILTGYDIGISDEL